MIICKTPQELKACLSDTKGEIGFVPTMGALHKGHLSLISASKKQNECTVCSIFVNPTQFNDSTDFQKYPNTIENDLEILKEHACDIVFLPSVEDMYSQKNILNFQFGPLENVMEGAFRPGHFNGVATVVSKFFHFVNPHKAYFGQKDLQQFAIINELTNALSFNINLKMCPILREDNGLAMSSRNTRLSAEERNKAQIINQTLVAVKNAILDNGLISSALENGVSQLSRETLFKLEYLKVVDQLSLQEIETINPKRKTAICIAGFFGKVRLIDNVVF